MEKLRLGCVPYINALPLIWGALKSNEIPAEVVYDVPSRLPELLESGQVDAILVSSIYPYLNNNVKLISNSGIVSHNKVGSVKIFSKVPFSRVNSIALDQSSMTSNQLALILLQEVYSCKPTTSKLPPDLDSMLEDHDAAVIIGDKGLELQNTELGVLDLGSSWRQLTGLPFLWAGWVVKNNSPSEIGELLDLSLAFSKDTCTVPPFKKELIEYAIQQSGWSEDTIKQYLSENIQFEISEEVLIGYQRYTEFLDVINIAEPVLTSEQ